MLGALSSPLHTKFKKQNVHLAVESSSNTLPGNTGGSGANPRRRVTITELNPDHYIFADFINQMLASIDNHPTSGDLDDRTCLMWDNFSCHKTSYVTNMIYGKLRATFVHCRCPF